MQSHYLRPQKLNKRLQDFKLQFPDIYKMLIESDKEMIMYKRNEHAYRRYTEKRSVRKMRRCIPPNFPLEISYLCKARSFMSGDFAYTTNIINNRFFGWMGDSISHGTGSNIVKNYVNRSILYVLKKHRDHPDISFQTLIKESQQRFFSTYNVKKILKENLSDIIPRNDYQAKMSILIPIFFFQIREINQKLFFKFSNRGMPYCLIFKCNSDRNRITQVILYTKTESLDARTQLPAVVKNIDHSGFPFVLDKNIYDFYTSDGRNEYSFPVIEQELAPGDIIAIPSDGVTEAQNKDGQEYGIHRFIKDFVEILEEQNMWKLNLTFIKEHYYNDKLRQYAIWDERYSLTGNGIEDDMGLLLIRVK